MNHQSNPIAEWSGPSPLALGQVSPRAGVIQEGEAPLATLGDMIGAVGRRWKPLALWIFVCLAAAFWYLHVTAPEYSAAATVILEPRRQTVATQDGASSSYPPTLDSAQAESQIQVIKSERILSSVFDLLDLQHAPEFADHGPGLRDRVLAAIGLTAKPGSGLPNADATAKARAFQAFSDRTNVRRIGQSYVLEVSYRAGTPEQASRIANAITAAYIKAQVDLKAAAAHNGTEYLQGRISDIKTEQDAALEGVLQGRIPSIQFPDADARVIGAALPPLGKSSPQTALILLLALSFAALTGLFTIAVRHALDRTLKTRSQIRHALGMECLGTLPDIGRLREMRATWRTSALDQAVITDPDSRFAQAVRATRIAVLSSAPPARHRAIGIVSWSHGEGRTTVASNLARLMAVSGDEVELIDGDLRNPVLTGWLAPNTTAGLNEALLGHGGLARMTSVRLAGSLSFVPAVAAGRSSEPNIYLGSAEMQALLAGLRADRDVVIDLPPLGASSDAQAISPLLDGVVLIVDAGRTTVDDALEALRALHAANAHVLGVVLNRAKPGGRKRRKPSTSGRTPPETANQPS